MHRALALVQGEPTNTLVLENVFRFSWRRGWDSPYTRILILSRYGIWRHAPCSCSGARRTHQHPCVRKCLSFFLAERVGFALYQNLDFIKIRYMAPCTVLLLWCKANPPTPLC